MGGYGLLSYHAVLNHNRDPDTRAAIVALYPVNDFELFYASDADCLILDNPSPFWLEQRHSLGLQWPAYPVGCLHNDYDVQAGLYDRLTQRVALLALADDVATRLTVLLGGTPKGKFPSWSSQGDVLKFPDSKDVISLNRLEKHGRSVDLQVPEVAAMWKNLPILLSSWKELSKDGVNVGIAVIPSRERVLFEYYNRQNRISELDSRFVTHVQKQVSLEQEMRRVLEDSGISFVFALEDVYQAYVYGLRNNIPTYPPFEEGHPVKLGYAAYAAAGRRLLVKMGMQ
jgi:hypothetical protein